MHMADALLTPEVGGVLYAATVTAVAASAVKLKKTETETSDVPLMAVSGAMVFAAQMINFTIPGTGSSGHITGGILLAALLGPYAGTLTIAAVLLIQCLFFADGGLLALGANIFNMGVIPCLFIYPLLFRPIMSRAPSLRRISIASVVSVVIADQFGAFSVVLSTTASGITELPFGAFALLMQPIYLAIGVVEGFVTAAILCFVYGARPEILTTAAYGPALAGNPAREGGEKRSVKRVIILLAICAVVCGTGISLLASTHPDGLEWSIQHLTGAIGLNNPGQTAALAQVQGKTAIMPDYAFKSGGGGTSAAGLIGAAFTFVLAGGAGLLLRAHNRGEERKSKETIPRRSRSEKARGIGDRIHELYALESLSGQDTAFHRLHPGAKILFTAAYILTIVSFGRYDVLGCIPYFLYPAVVMPLARLPASLLLRRFLIALPFCAFAGVTNFFLDQNTAFTMGGIAVSYGLLSLITILLRTFLCVMAVFILIATTPFPSLTRTLRQFHIPQFFIQLIEMIYRYLGVLTEEAGSMSLAYKLRSAGARGIEMRHMGSFAGQLALRSFDRGERVYNAMLCRGYGHGFPDREKIRFRRADGICAAAFIALFLLLRFFPPLTLL